MHGPNANGEPGSGGGYAPRIGTGSPHRPALALAAGLVLGLGLAACGGADGDGESAATSPTSPTSSSSAPTSSAAIATSTTGPAAEALTDDARLRFDGIGPVKVGMTPEEATAAAGRPVGVDPDSLLDRVDQALCGHAVMDGGPKGLSFMVTRRRASESWRIARVDVVEGSRIVTVSGLRTGAIEADVRRVYGQAGGSLTEEPHEYVEGGHYLLYDVDGPGGMLLLFETDGTRVTQFRSGRDEEVRYVEGCA